MLKGGKGTLSDRVKGDMTKVNIFPIDTWVYIRHNGGADLFLTDGHLMSRV